MGIKDIKEHNIKKHGHQYQDRKDNGYRVISPSGVSKLYSNPYEWRLNVLDNITTFFGNESTVIGSLVHRYIELYREGGLTKDGKLPSIERDHILSTTTDYDIKKIHNDYPMMCESVRENYLEVYPTDVYSEEYLELDIPKHKILVAGTIDEIDINNKVIVDFKTCSKAPTDENSIVGYMYQLSVYANLLSATKDIEVDRFRIVFIQRPTKTIGARVYIAECKANYELGNIVNEAIDIIKLTDEKPELLDLIFRENPLSGYTIPDKDKSKEFISKHIKDFKLVTQEETKVNKLKKDIFG